MHKSDILSIFSYFQLQTSCLIFKFNVQAAHVDMNTHMHRRCSMMWCKNVHSEKICEPLVSMLPTLCLILGSHKLLFLEQDHLFCQTMIQGNKKSLLTLMQLYPASLNTQVDGCKLQTCRTTSIKSFWTESVPYQSLQ